MIQIDKDILKEYINQKNSDKHITSVIRVTEVIDYKIKTQKIYKHMILPESYEAFHLESPELEKLEKDGYYEATFIRLIWNGWSLVTRAHISANSLEDGTYGLVGTFRYQENRQNIACNIDKYKIWLRDYKLNQVLSLLLLIYNLL
jgi:hypothetical protein